jgi:hypothetical protein
MRFLFLTSFLLVSVLGHGQATVSLASDTIRWSSDLFMDNQAADSYPVACTFITYGDQRVEWIQKNGTYISHYQVTGVSGVWSDLAANGTCTLSLSRQAVSGQLTLERDSQGLRLRLLLTSPSGSVDNTYFISTFEKL